MQREIKEHDGTARVIKLNPKITLQDFFIVLCWDYELAARFILNWYIADSIASVKFISSFLSTARSDLNLMSCELTPKNSAFTRLNTPGGSVCRVALLRFCELLNESPELVKAIRHDANYLSATEGNDFFANRETNVISLTRDINWEAKGFSDPQPISVHARKKYHEQCRIYRQKKQTASIKEENERVAAKEKKKAERLLEVRAKTGLRKNISDDRKAFRDRMLSMELIDQVIELASNFDCPIKAFPINPRQITNDIIGSLTMHQRHQLMERIDSRWEKDWVSLGQRIREVNKQNG